jgi:hypothetical protein
VLRAAGNLSRASACDTPRAQSEARRLTEASWTEIAVERNCDGYSRTVARARAASTVVVKMGSFSHPSEVISELDRESVPIFT